MADSQLATQNKSQSKGLKPRAPGSVATMSPDYSFHTVKANIVFCNQRSLEGLQSFGAPECLGQKLQNHHCWNPSKKRQHGNVLHLETFSVKYSVGKKNLCSFYWT